MRTVTGEENELLVTTGDHQRVADPARAQAQTVSPADKQDNLPVDEPTLTAIPGQPTIPDILTGVTEPVVDGIPVLPANMDAGARVTDPEPESIIYNEKGPKSADEDGEPSIVESSQNTIQRTGDDPSLDDNTLLQKLTGHARTSGRLHTMRDAWAAIILHNARRNRRNDEEAEQLKALSKNQGLEVAKRRIEHDGTTRSYHPSVADEKLRNARTVHAQHQAGL